MPRHNGLTPIEAKMVDTITILALRVQDLEAKLALAERTIKEVLSETPTMRH